MSVMPEPLISVVVATFNSAKYLVECLDSVLGQAGVRMDVIVVDDGSTDGTRQVVDRYGDSVRYLYQDNSGGPASPKNHGSRMALGDFITFFDADDVMLPGKLESQIGVLRRRTDIACVVTDYRDFNGAGDVSASHFETCHLLLAELTDVGSGEYGILTPERARAILIDENFSSGGGPMFPRAFFDDLGGFDPALTASEDYHIIYRASLKTPTAVLRRVGFRRRLHDTNMTQQHRHMLSMQALCRTKLSALEPDPELRRRLRRAAAKYQLGLVEQLGRRGHGASALRALFSADARAGWTSRQALRAALWCIVGPTSHLLRRRAARP